MMWRSPSTWSWRVWPGNNQVSRRRCRQEQRIRKSASHSRERPSETQGNKYRVSRWKGAEKTQGSDRRPADDSAVVDMAEEVGYLGSTVKGRIFRARR